MDIIEKITSVGIVPVVVLEDAKDAVSAAKALIDGGVTVMEITFRTNAAEESIRLVSKNCPDMVVGAGTVITLEQCKSAVAAGARFIVSPGFDEQVVRWCLENGITVIPGCVTPSEIMNAMKFNLKVLKFFPANVYGGLPAMKSLSAPFGGIRFMPTGGITSQNIGEYAAAPYVHAVGGSWICPSSEISAGHFERITELCREARQNLLGFEIAHIGINANDEEESTTICDQFTKAFGFQTKAGTSSNFSGSGIEVMKTKYLGDNGHIAIYTNSIESAIYELAARGLETDPATAKYKGTRLIAIYLKQQIGGFAVHLLQK